MRKHLYSIAAGIAVAALAVALAAIPTTGNTAAADPLSATVWAVNAQAPYAPHLWAFDAAGMMVGTNPTNVQEHADGSGTHDSVALGYWRHLNRGRYLIDFWELNANQQLGPATGKAVPADTLEVQMTLVVTGDMFASIAGMFTLTNPTTGVVDATGDTGATGTLRHLTSNR